MTPAEQFIAYAYRIGAFRFPPEGFTLKGKRRSPYLFNSGVFCTGESIGVLARAYLVAVARDFHPDVFFGTAYKGIPIATAIVQILGGHVGLAYNRKETKDHAEGGIVVGASLYGKNVLIVDDAMTTGDSLREACQIIRAAEASSIGCVIAYDRQEIGNDGSRSAIQEFKEDFGIDVRSVARLDDFISFLERICKSYDSSDIDTRTEPPFKAYENILAYRAKYGAT